MVNAENSSRALASICQSSKCHIAFTIDAVLCPNMSNFLKHDYVAMPTLVGIIKTTIQSHRLTLTRNLT